MKTYTALLSSDPLLTKPVAAIESLILLLSHHPPSTAFETLDLISSAVDTLKASIPNPIALSAGTDLFQQYLKLQLSAAPRSSADKGGRIPRSTLGGRADDFQAIRTHLVSNGKLFASRAKEARGKIAGLAARFLGDGSTVMTCGNSRCVELAIKGAVQAGKRLKVAYVVNDPGDAERCQTLDYLKGTSIPVAMIPAHAVALALSSTSMVIVGAEGVVENGGIFSGMGTYQLGLLAKTAGKPFYVAVESHKFVRMFPLGKPGTGGLDIGPTFKTGSQQKSRDSKDHKEEGQEKLDFTPPELITALITESGVHTPSAVSEQLIHMWY